MMVRNGYLFRGSQPRLWRGLGHTAAMQAVGAYQFCALIGESRVLWPFVQTLAQSLKGLQKRLVRAGHRLVRVCLSAQNTLTRLGQAASPSGNQELRYG